MSNHSIEVIEVKEIFPHPNADQLEMTRVGGWNVCIGKGDFNPGDFGIYIPPDFIVPIDRPEFAFLKKKEGQKTERIRVRRLRGQLSQGLLIPLSERFRGWAYVGLDVADYLDIVRYEPPIKMSMSADLFIGGPSGIYSPKFDVENYQRYVGLIKPGESVIITEKIHGANARYVFAADKEGKEQLFCGSRTHWVDPEKPSPWTVALKQNPGIDRWCRLNPDCILYGEVFGQVQDLKYGAKKNQVFFAAFAALQREVWMEWRHLENLCDETGVPMVPKIFMGPFDEKLAYDLAEGDSLWFGANHMREGVVILLIPERNDPEIGRVILKMVSNRYLEKSH